ncbi:MAG: hypothetical protein JKY70_19800 [Mucilaginibacter sp.]|nr:hypothetical protein [Mucilaginibacter sp.]
MKAVNKVQDKNTSMGVVSDKNTSMGKLASAAIKPANEVKNILDPSANNNQQQA